MQNKIIGLTGGTGSGKTLAAKTFAQQGALVIDADKISHEITDSDEEVLAKIKETFSENANALSTSIIDKLLGIPFLIPEEVEPSVNLEFEDEPS